MFSGRIFTQALAIISIFIFSLVTHAAGSAVGKLTIVKGKVFILRDGEKISANKGDSVFESDSVESESGGLARVTMIDSNLIDVYPKTKVAISKYVFKPSENKKKVELKVDFGKIKSTVNQKYDDAKNTFQVKTPSAVAGVRGTVFTTEYDPIKKVSEVVTIEGLVAVAKVAENEKLVNPVFVKPNQIANVDSAKPKEEVRELKIEEKEKRKKEDNGLGLQYDPRKEMPKESAEGEGRHIKPPMPPPLQPNSSDVRPPPEIKQPLIEGTATRLTNVPPPEIKPPEIKAPEIKPPEVKLPTEVRLPIVEPKPPIADTSAIDMERRQRLQEAEQAKRQREAEEAAKRREEELRRAQELAQLQAEEAAKRAAEEAARAAEEAAKRAAETAETVTQPVTAPVNTVIPGAGTGL